MPQALMLMSDKYYNYSILKKLGTPIFKLASRGPKYLIEFFPDLNFMTSGQEMELTKVYFQDFKPCRLFY